MRGTHLKPSAKSEFTTPNCLAPGEYGGKTDQPLLRSYLTLGLQHDLNPIPSGGFEVNVTRTVDPINTCQPHPTASSSTNDDASYVSEGPTVTSALPKGFGRIVRDSSGNVVRVELPSNEEVGHASKREPVIDPLVVTTESELRIWAQDHPEMRRGAGSEAMEDTIVQGQLSICAGRSLW